MNNRVEYVYYNPFFDRIVIFSCSKDKPELAKKMNFILLGVV